jgi:hypothetical protein
MPKPNFFPTVFIVNGDFKTLDTISKGDSYMLNLNCGGFKSLKQSDEIRRDEKSFSLSNNFLNEKKASSPSNKGKIPFEEKKFLLNGAEVPISCVLTSTEAYMCDTYSATFGLLQSAESIEANGKAYRLQGKYLNVTDFKRIEVSALFDREDGFQGPVKLTIQGKDTSSGGLIINPEIFEEKTFPVKGFVCLIDNRPWRITQNSRGIWSNTIPSGEVFEAFRALRLPRDDEKA